MILQNLDKLTGLYVQKYFEKRLEEEMLRSNRYKRPLTLVLFEINYNYFKTNFNVRWAMVYTILKQFGAILLNRIRNVDIAGRYGGEMFTLLMPETPSDGAMIAADRIREAITEHLFIGDSMHQEIKLAVNGGLASFPLHGKTPQELISSAQKGLLIARNEGGNKIVLCPQQLYDDNGTSISEDGNSKMPSIDESEREESPSTIKNKTTGEESPNEASVSENEANKEEENKTVDLKEAIEKKMEEIKKNLEDQMKIGGDES